MQQPNPDPNGLTLVSILSWGPYQNARSELGFPFPGSEQAWETRKGKSKPKLYRAVWPSRRLHPRATRKRKGRPGRLYCAVWPNMVLCPVGRQRAWEEHKSKSMPKLYCVVITQAPTTPTQLEIIQGRMSLIIMVLDNPFPGLMFLRSPAGGGK